MFQPAIDKCSGTLYNNRNEKIAYALSRVAEGMGPMKPGNRSGQSRKHEAERAVVLNPTADD